MPLKLFRLAAILLVALLCGLAFAHVLELPAKMQYDATLYITLQKSLYVHWGPPWSARAIRDCRDRPARILPAQEQARSAAQLGSAVRAVAGVSDRLLLVSRPRECRLPRCNAAEHSAQLDRSAFKLGNEPRHSFRASVCGIVIACSIAGTRREHDFI